MPGRLLEIAVRPVRIAFLLGRDPSKRLVNTVISINSGLWGGIYNFICPTNGNIISDEYLTMLGNHRTDCIVLCGVFEDRQAIISQLTEHNIQPVFLQKRISLELMETFGIGVEGIFDSRFLHGIQRNIFQDIAIVDPRIGNSTYLDKVRFGIPPARIKKYVEDRGDFISVKRYNRISDKHDDEYDEILGTIEMTSENIGTYRLRGGRRFTSTAYRYGRLYCVVGDAKDLDDACYFWNLRAIFGADRVIWIDKDEVGSFINKREAAFSRGVTLTTASTIQQAEITKLRKGSGGRTIPFSRPRALFRVRCSSLQSEIRTLHMPSEGEFIITTARPSLFELRYPRNPRWAMDVRIIKDDVIGTEGFMLPEFSYLSGMLTPTQGSRLLPRITGEVFSLQVTSARTDQHFRFRIPTDWEVIQSIFNHHDYEIGLSDQGNYMSRTLNLFGGLSRLSSLLMDNRVTVILNEFAKHHRTGEQATYDARYRRALTLDDMKKVVIGFAGKSAKKRQSLIDYVDTLVTELISLGAIHSGYVLNCTQCSLEEWYPIDEVGESFRCHRCLAREVRPPSPPMFFRLNEALHQAYMHNFAVPTLVLDLLRKSCNTSFIFSPQVKLKKTDPHSPELDISAICDGQLTLGEAKSNDKIEKSQLEEVESTALRVKAHCILLATSSRGSCQKRNCDDCSKKENYADNAFTHGTSRSPKYWGTRERIIALRDRLTKQGVRVDTVCPQDIAEGAMLRSQPRAIFVPTRRVG